MLVLALSLIGCEAAAPAWDEHNPRPVRWAQHIETPGLPNLARVDEGLFRGAQPRPEGFAALKTLGVRTVINLRAEHDCHDDCAANGLGYVHVPQRAWTIDDADAIAFLKAAAVSADGPFFIHCQHGADRTGTMVAVYRVVVQGWSREDAIDEMVRGGFGYHVMFRNLIAYIRNLDADKLRREAGIARGVSG
jgi:protein tyrosine/serine phosphatase